MSALPLLLSLPISNNLTHLDFRLRAAIESGRPDTFLSGSYNEQSLDSEYWRDQMTLRLLISLLLNHFSPLTHLCSYLPSISCTLKYIY